MNKSYDVITGANGFIGSALAEKLIKNNPILLTTKKNTVRCTEYNMAHGLSTLNDIKVNVENVYHLAHDFSNKSINGENINIKGIKDLIYFCEQKNAKLIYMSSFMAIPAIDDYGKTKLECEKLVEAYRKSTIIRPPVVVDHNGGIFTKINKIFKYLPFFILPGHGNYIMYYVNLENLVDFIIKSKDLDIKEIIYCYDKGPVLFKELLNTRSKLVIKVPIYFLRALLFLAELIGIRIKSISNDGLNTLLTMPRISFKHKNYTEY